jgi:hypothetical protein
VAVLGPSQPVTEARSPSSARPITASASDPLLPKPDRGHASPAMVLNDAGLGTGVLSVIVRWGPVMSVVNGTLVSRLTRMTPVSTLTVG